MLKGESTPADTSTAFATAVSQPTEALVENVASHTTQTIGEDEIEEGPLNNQWDAYADKLKELGKPIVSSILVSVRPQLQENSIIHLIFDNKIQLERFEEEQVALLHFLKTSLNNKNIAVTSEIIEGTGPQVIFSLQDRYHHMVTKNPVVEELKKRFNMSLE